MYKTKFILWDFINDTKIQIIQANRSFTAFLLRVQKIVLRIFRDFVSDVPSAS